MNINIYPHPWDLRYFQEIAATLNLSRASERLAVGQPALSLALKRLEESLQTKLFIRRNRGLSLTPAGEKLLRESNRLLSNWEAILYEVKRSETELVGQYRLGCHPSVAIYCLKRVLRQLYSECPGIEMRLTHGLSRVISEGVVSGTLDFGIVINPIQHPDLVINKLAIDEVCFWKSQNALEDVLIYNPELTQSQELLKKSKNKVSFKRTITSDNLELIASLTSTGTGIAILPDRVVRNLAPNVKKISGMPSYRDQVAFVYRADLPKSSSSKYIIKLLKSLSI